MPLPDELVLPDGLTGPGESSWTTGFSWALTVLTTIVVVDRVLDGAWEWALAVFLDSVLVEALVLAVVSRRRRNRRPPAGVGG